MSTKAHRFTLYILYSIIQWILFLEFKSKQTDSIRIFNKCGQRNRVIRNEIIFLTAFIETLLEKWSQDELLDLKPTRNKLLFCSSMIKIITSAYSYYTGNKLRIWLSRQIKIYIRNKFKVWIKGLGGYLIYKPDFFIAALILYLFPMF
jgi:hypothetical protein